MNVVPHLLALILAAAGAVLALAGLGLLVTGNRKKQRRFKADIDRLHDEVWELREASAARERAEAANEAKSRFLATVSHEVRTPLNGILGMAELLSGSELDAEQATYVAAIRTSGSALASLIDEILDFSKIEAGKVELASERFDVIALVEGVAELLAPRAQGKNLEIAVSIAADVPRHVVGDAVRLRQILLNLAGNAVKFTEAGGVGLGVRMADRDAALLRFEIADTGPGIPADRRAAVFEDFEQADSSTTRLHGGTGLGLAISKRLAERMGGAIRLLSSNQGALFSILLPLPVADGEAPRLETPALAGKAVLIVADSAFQAPYLANHLTELGMRVETAADVPNAMRHLRSCTTYDIVIVDCALGASATRDLGAAARAAGVGQRLVLFSPFERRAFGQTSASDYDGWLVKPVRRDSVVALLAHRRSEPLIAPVPDRPVAGPFAVLLAEDNEINALLARRHLQKLGATVTHAPDGLSALALAEAALDAGAPFHAMVLDIRMPGLDGLELARRIRLAEYAHQAQPARLVALSADLMDAERRSGSRAGIDAFLGKPVSFARLQSALRPEIASQPA